MRYPSALVVVAASVVGLPSSVDAAFITQNLNINALTTSTVSGGSSQLVSLTFSKFDPALGTLDRVTWSYQGNIHYLYRGVGGPQFLDPESGELADTYGGILWFNRQVYLYDTAGAEIANPFFNNGEVQGFLVLGPNQTSPNYPGFTSRPPDTFGPSMYEWAGGVLTTPFVGAGTGTLSVRAQVAQAFQSQPPGTNLAFLDGKSEFNFASTLTFEYTPVPAPGTLMLPAALAGVCLRRRR